MDTRVCRKCGLLKPLSSFQRIPRGWRGSCYRCRDGRPPLEKAPPGSLKPKRFHRALDSKRYLITAAQNAAPVHKAFFKTLQTAAEHLDAELVVVPLRYKNPTSQWSKHQKTYEWWDDAVLPFLFNQRKKLNPNLVLLGDVKTQPTATKPLTGFESLTGPESSIIAHTKMQLKTVPVPSGRFPKILTTTGCCTLPDYTDSKAGKIAQFHHFLGAIIVEVQGKKFHLRQLNADRQDGSFIDLDTLYTEKSVKQAPRALGLVMGDIHARFIDKRVESGTFGDGGLVEVLDPEQLIWHDTNDNYVVNPHHLGNPFIAQAKLRGKLTNVREEVEHAIRFVQERSKRHRSTIVASNHDDFLARWVVRADWKSDPGNAKFYLETALAMLESVTMTEGGTRYADPFQYWVRKLAPDIHAAQLDESVKVGDIECGMHGHLGPGGAQGTVQNLSRLGVKTITGHGHGPAIEEGHYRVGKSTGKLEYEHGPDGSLQTHCVVYANGKRSLINFIDGDWHLDDAGSRA